jgi:hypothetical protein
MAREQRPGHSEGMGVAGCARVKPQSNPGGERRSDPQLPDPRTILDDPNLTREQKIKRLRQLSYDARELDVATEEGMTGPKGLPSNLPRIQEALRELGAEDESTTHKQ